MPKSLGELRLFILQKIKSVFSLYRLKGQNGGKENVKK